MEPCSDRSSSLSASSAASLSIVRGCGLGGVGGLTGGSSGNTACLQQGQTRLLLVNHGSIQCEWKPAERRVRIE